MAGQIVAALEKAEKSGSASIRVNGRFIDCAIYENAKTVLQYIDWFSIQIAGGVDW